MLKKQVEFQKVQEKTYDKPIKDIAYDKAIMDGVERVYPKIVIFEDEVQFLNEKGEIVTRKSLVVTKPKEVGKYFGREVAISSKGSFIAIGEYTGKSADAMEYIVEEEFTICNDRGEEIYRIKGPMEGMGENDQWLISDKDGSAVGTRIAYGAIDFYSPDGSIKTVQLFGELGWKRRTGHVSFSGDGEYLALLLNELTIEKTMSRDKDFSSKADVWIMLFDKSGNELWMKHVDQELIGNISLSNKGEYLIFKAYSYKGGVHQRKGEVRELGTLTISLYDKEGNELSFTDTSLFKYGGFRFSPKADYAALAGDNLIWLMRTKDGSTIFKTELPKNRRIRDILFSEDGQYLIVKTETKIGTEKMGGGHIPIYIYPVFIFNIKGYLVWQKDFSDLRKISSLDGSLIFSFPQSYEIFKEIE
jgi:hypothetical protein